MDWYPFVLHMPMYANTFTDFAGRDMNSVRINQETMVWYKYNQKTLAGKPKHFWKSNTWKQVFLHAYTDLWCCFDPCLMHHYHPQSGVTADSVSSLFELSFCILKAMKLPDRLAVHIVSPPRGLSSHLINNKFICHIKSALNQVETWT